MNTFIDIPAFIDALLPGSLRTGVMKDWIKALLIAFKYVHDTFNKITRKANLEEAAITSQVVMLEHILNKRFDPGQSPYRINIVDPADLLNRVSLYLENEQQPATEAYLLSEIPPGTHLELYEEAEYAGDVNFVVEVETAINLSSVSLQQLDASVQKYKLGGMAYKLEMI